MVSFVLNKPMTQFYTACPLPYPATSSSTSRHLVGERLP